MNLFSVFHKPPQASATPPRERQHPPSEGFAACLHARAGRALTEPLAQSDDPGAGPTPFDQAALLRTTSLPGADQPAGPGQSLAGDASAPSEPNAAAPVAIAPAQEEAPLRTMAPIAGGGDKSTPRPTAISQAPTRLARPPHSAASFQVGMRPADELARPDAARALARRAPAQTHTNPVLVALHAIEGELNVYARPGRMAPTERQRLRNAIAALLAQFGIFDASVTVEHGGGKAWRK